MERVRKFNGDKATKEDLKEYFIQVIQMEAVERLFNGKDVSHIKDAKDLIDKCFDQMDLDFKVQQDNATHTNKAR